MIWSPQLPAAAKGKLATAAQPVLVSGPADVSQRFAGGNEIPAGLIKSRSKDLPQRGPLSEMGIMSVNYYVGTEFDSILALTLPANPTELDLLIYQLRLLAGVTEAYYKTLMSNIPLRANELAREISDREPVLVGLQEVCLIANHGVLTNDYLAILLAALKSAGAGYAPVAISTNSVVNMPVYNGDPADFADPTTIDPEKIGLVTYVDYNVILAREGLPRGQFFVFGPKQGLYEHYMSLPIGVEMKRGWCSVEVFHRGRVFRFLNTHLEEESLPAIQEAQAAELLTGPANVAWPVVLVGDFNSNASGAPTTRTYEMLTTAGRFTDAWRTVHPGAPGLTWGHDETLADPTVLLQWRLDLILIRGYNITPVSAEVIDPRLSETTPPFWASDHARVFTRIGLW